MYKYNFEIYMGIIHLPESSIYQISSNYAYEFGLLNFQMQNYTVAVKYIFSHHPFYFVVVLYLNGIA